MRHPSPYPDDAFAELTAAVQLGGYCRYDDSSALPSSLSRIAGRVDSFDYRTTLVAHSTTSAQPPPISGVTPAPHSSILSVTVFRADVARKSNEHFNRDEIVLFQDAAGRHWQLHTKDVPSHCRPLSGGSQLPEVDRIYRLPSATTGRLEDLTKLYARY